MNELLFAIAAALAELVSRGTNHPNADQLIGIMRVALQQATDLAGSPPPPPEPVETQLVGINDRVADVTERVARTLAEIIHRLDNLQAAVDAAAK